MILALSIAAVLVDSLLRPSGERDESLNASALFRRPPQLSGKAFAELPFLRKSEKFIFIDSDAFYDLVVVPVKMFLPTEENKKKN